MNIVNILENKSVIIVGPAEHVNCGDYIDSYDVVIRLNHGIKLSKLEPKKYGTKTNIVYHCVNQEPENGGEINYLESIDHLVLAYPILKPNESVNFKCGNEKYYNLIDLSNPKISSVDKEKYFEFEKKIDTRPNCGTMAIWDILNYNIKKLELIGFTLFQTSFNENYRNISNEKMLSLMKKYKTHDQEKIAKYYKELIDENKISYDNEFITNVNKVLCLESKEFKINEVIKNIHDIGYKLNFLSNNKNSNSKIIYKILMNNNDKIIINKILEYKNSNKESIFIIHKNINSNTYDIFMNDILLNSINSLKEIKYYNNNFYDLSIIIPLSLLELSFHSYINFDYIFKKLKEIGLNLNICISHSEKYYNSFLDNFVLNNNINYIFIKNEFNFNLGYNRNLWKYIANSDKIMFIDIDIPLTKDIILDLIDKSKKYDIVKPYDKNLIHLNENEKYEYLIKNKIDLNNKKSQCLFSITGGITLFDKNILIETGGYEEYNSYGYEDRCLDVIILNNKYTVFKIDNTMIHLYHPKSIENQKENFKNTRNYVIENYNCFFSNKNINDIHEFCEHKTKKLEYFCFYNKNYNSNLNLFNESNILSANLKYKKNKILIFTDSRGEYKASFNDKKIFTEKLKEYFTNFNVSCDLMLCPFSWTSTLEFIECIENKIINKDNYDFIILYTGVVEYSPRPISNYNKAYNEYNNDITFDRLVDRDRKYGKIFNNKEKIAKKIFTEQMINNNVEMNTIYENEKTKSLISLEMNEKVIISYLQKLGNKLIYINSNKIVSGWEGNYLNVNPNGRPKNINIIEDFSKQSIGKFENYINLLEWNDDEIKNYTIDNMHLTYEGSEYIYNKILSVIKK